MEDAGVQRGIWDGDAKTVQQCLTDIFTSVYTTCDIPENAIFGPCVLSHTSLYDSIAFIALKSTDKRTVPYIFRCNASFRMTSDLVYHMRSHHKKEYALEPLVKRRREEKLKCPICNESFRETVIYSGISVILGILEIFAVSQGIVGIRGVFSNKFLAMSKKGKLHASARFTVDCHFRERFQENSYNTYASAVHRSPRSGRPWYVALNKRGKAKRGCSPRARPQHVSTHFLPRFGQPQPPELAFTVALPDKKPPPPKAKPAPAPPRRNPGPARYRLKFRFG
ncbi:fibroblast growth factor 5 [Geospiza fortis]|uniref:Fibroblast growth factor 5 n=1 Tax=Geospiza fortis TaxID=48883 RepID=A0A8N5F3V3_GEOFO|nr:fibroblast growth factor 5 [Geospiza fortis]